MRRLLLLALAPLAVAAQPSLRDVTPRPPLADPSLSPDGREIAFVSGGDVWSVPAEGGEARLLVSHAATESRPLWSPDGRRLAFVSNRTGNGDVYVLDLASGALRRVTHDDAPEVLDAWSRDGRWLYFSSSAGDVANMQDVHRVRADGGTPMPVAADRYASEYWGAPSPDGRTLAITARGTVSGQWWRHGHSHLDESEIWLVSDLDGAAPRYTAVTTGGAKSAWPMWSPDGATVYFMSDRGGAENLWAQPLAAGRPAGAARQLTRFTDGRVLWPSAAADGRAIVFERDFGVWRYDVATGQARAVPITLRGAPAGAGAERVAIGGAVQELAVSPDGRKVAVVARGEVFAAAAKPEPNSATPEAARVTTTPEAERQLAWHPDSRRLAYASERGGRWRVYVYDFTTREERALTSGEGGGDVSPRWSPDGRALAFVRGGRELRVVDVAAAGAGSAPSRERAVARGAFGWPPFADVGELAWSPDGRWLAYATSTAPKEFTNVFVARADAEADPASARQVSFLANAFGGDVAWSPDGTYLLFGTGQRTEPGRVARVDLVPRAPRFRETLFEQLFTPPGRPADSVGVTRQAARPAPGDSLRVPADSAPAGAQRAARGDSAARRATRIVLDDIRQRASLLPLGGIDVQTLAISPDGKQLLVVAQAAGQTNLWTYPLDELAGGDQGVRQLTSTAGFKQDAQWAPDSREVYFREGGRVQAVNVETRALRQVAVTGELEVDFAREKEQVYRQAWTYLRDNFYDDKFHGADWGAVGARVAPQVAAARTSDELRRVLSLMVGELNASHLGVTGPPAQPQPTTGRLGVRLDRAAYERDGTLRVAEVLPLGPADLAGVRAGDAIVAVDGQAVGADANLQELLANRINRRVRLTLRGAGGATRTADVRPVALGAEKQLAYRAWVEGRRAYVARASGGRLGYVHMPDMGEGSLAQLHVDLDAENQARDGVVIDIRNNNGGFVNAYALDVFARRPYLTMRTRGRGPSPARAQLGQRALERPTVLVTNQHSLSDAEDFTEGYRALGLGKVVGEPTSGWIIYTWNVGLVDGTTLRLPRTLITGVDGKNMELNPRPVDVPVERPMGESYTGRDSQLDAAIRTLLAQLDTRSAQR